MPVGPVIPYGNIVLIPFVPNLSIVVLSDQLYHKIRPVSFLLHVPECGGLTLKRYCNSISDSSLVMPFIRFVKPLFTKTDFQPVTAIMSLEL
jgi:hypothetical protein